MKQIKQHFKPTLPPQPKRRPSKPPIHARPPFQAAISAWSKWSAACIVIVFQIILLAAPANDVYAQGVGDSRVKAGDTLSVSVFEEKSLTNTFLVSTSGEIPYPLLGSLKVVGMTVAQVSATIESLLEKDYIIDAKVAVTLAVRPDNSVLIIGQVNSPGAVPFKAGAEMDLFIALAAAGGLTENADGNIIDLQRGKNNYKYAFNRARSVPLKNGDTITVNPKPKLPDFTFTILGSVKKENKFVLPGVPGRERLTVSECIAMAGGFTEGANRSRVTVSRVVGGRTQNITVDLSKIRRGKSEPFLIQNGDTIRAKDSWF